MPDIEIKGINNEVTGKMSLPEDMFGAPAKGAKAGLLHESVLNYLANQRQGTHATKTKGLVSGGGKKPWKQKHTGRARAGSNRSPLWRGGGTVFGPLPRDYSYDMPRQAKRQALYAAISEKIASGELVVVESLKFEGPKTKKMAEIIKNLGIGEGSILVVDVGPDDKGAKVNTGLYLSARNIPGVRCRAAADLNAYEVLSHGRVLMTRAAVESLNIAEKA